MYVAGHCIQILDGYVECFCFTARSSSAKGCRQAGDCVQSRRLIIQFATRRCCRCLEPARCPQQRLVPRPRQSETVMKVKAGASLLQWPWVSSKQAHAPQNAERHIAGRAVESILGTQRSSGSQALPEDGD